MKPLLATVLAALGIAFYYGIWRLLASIGFSPLWASLMVLAIAALLAGIATLSFPKE